MDYYLNIFVRNLPKDKFYDIITTIERFSSYVIQTEKDSIIGRTNNINILSCFLKMKEIYPEARFGFSQFIGLAKGLSKIAKFGEILISEEVEQQTIEDYDITSLGMLSIEGMSSQILVCRLDNALSEIKFPEQYRSNTETNYRHRRSNIGSLQH